MIKAIKNFAIVFRSDTFVAWKKSDYIPKEKEIIVVYDKTCFTPYYDFYLGDGIHPMGQLQKVRPEEALFKGIVYTTDGSKVIFDVHGGEEDNVET